MHLLNKFQLRAQSLAAPGLNKAGMDYKRHVPARLSGSWPLLRIGRNSEAPQTMPTMAAD